MNFWKAIIIFQLKFTFSDVNYKVWFKLCKLLQKSPLVRYNKRIIPIIKHIWNVAMHVLHQFFEYFTNTAAYRLGQNSSASPCTLEHLRPEWWLVRCPQRLCKRSSLRSDLAYPYEYLWLKPLITYSLITWAIEALSEASISTNDQLWTGNQTFKQTWGVICTTVCFTGRRIKSTLSSSSSLLSLVPAV